MVWKYCLANCYIFIEQHVVSLKIFCLTIDLEVTVLILRWYCWAFIHFMYIFICAKLLQLCPTLCAPMDTQASLSARLLQARVLECIAVPSFKGSSRPRNWTHISCTSCIAGRFFTHCATWEAPDCKCIGYLFLWSCGWQGTSAHHAAQHQEGVLYYILLPQEKIKIQSKISTECIPFLLPYHCKV